MGTSRSKPNIKPGKPLVPEWADEEPRGDSSPEPDAGPQAPAPKAPNETTQPGRFSQFRRSLREFGRTGDEAEAHAALGNFSRATGAGAAAASRITRAARVGGALLGGLARAGEGVGPAGDRLDIRTLAGQSVREVIDTLLDAFAPPGILDEVEIRIALGAALEEELGEGDFDPNSINDDVIQALTIEYVEQIVFQQILGDVGDSFSGLTPLQEAERERTIVGMIRAVVDITGRPLIIASPQLSETTIQTIISQLVRNTMDQIAGW